jgi:hypothetical protein
MGMLESGTGDAYRYPVASPVAPGIGGRPEGIPRFGAQPGRVLGLVGPPGAGLTRLGLSMLAEPSRLGMVAVVDVRGWLSPLAAWEVGLTPERLVVVHCPDRARWGQVTAALVEGLGAVYAEVPEGTADAVLRRLGALARARRVALLLRPVRGRLPSGLAHLRLEGIGVAWEGAEAGHGRLTRRRLTVRAAGRGVGGVEQQLEVEDDGTDAVQVAPFGSAAASPRRAAG